MCNNLIDKTVLALDCASKTCSVAVAKGGKVLCSIDTDTMKTHSLTLLPSVKYALELSGLNMDDVEAVAVTSGPGSFTGLKIGVTTAKGLAFPKDLPCAAVSSMSALAYGCTGFDGIICTSFDARRNMLYNAMFRVWGGRVERLCEDRQSSAEEVATEVVSTASALGCKVMLVGDGSDALASFLEESGLSVVSDSRGVKASDIISAVNAGDYTCHSSSTLVPEYLRPSQAERERNERLSKKS